MPLPLGGDSRLSRRLALSLACLPACRVWCQQTLAQGWPWSPSHLSPAGPSGSYPVVCIS